MPTALVTGASSGIGEAYARELAARGYDLVLVARSTDKLHQLRDEFGEKVAIEVLPADLTDRPEMHHVEERLAATTPSPIDLLVNNAGFGTTGRFDELSLEQEDREIRLNVLAVMRLSHAVLPGMVKRGKGGIINVSSIAGFQPAPGNATYCGTKAFVTTFSLSLHEEYRSKGITVLCVAPGPTRTEWQANAAYDASVYPAFVWQDADDVVQGSLNALDHKRPLYVSGWPNKLVAGATHLAPRSLLARVAGMVSRQV